MFPYLGVIYLTFDLSLEVGKNPAYINIGAKNLTCSDGVISGGGIYCELSLYVNWFRVTILCVILRYIQFVEKND